MGKSLFNGVVIDTDEVALPLPNRGLAFSDGFFETLIYSQNKLHLVADHVARMQRAAAALHLVLPTPLATAEALERTLAQLVAAQELPAARLRLQLWRSGGGRYTPLTAEAEWLATAEPFKPDDTPIGKADFALETQSMLSPLSFCKGPQAWLYVRAAYERQQRGLDEIILCNAARYVAEAGAAAIFWLKQGQLYTPALETGCVAGVRRAEVLRIARAQSIPCQEGLYKPEELLAAETVFTANVAAIRVVQGIGQRTFATTEPSLLALLRQR
jgi:branched-subunit amino acid aminotransferase/4-amino-4-deoxychorismate lyase